MAWTLERTNSLGVDITPAASAKALSNNKYVEYVILFRFKDTEEQKVRTQFENLIGALDRVGLRTEARDGGNGSVLVFVRVRSERKLIAEVYRSRIKDWLHGVRPAAPDKETQKSLDKEPLTEAERLRIVNHLITYPESGGGAGITPRKGQWSLVERIFPLHDHEFNKAWMKRWSRTWIVGPEELEKLRNRFGEKVAFYFAFLQCYFSFLIIAAAIGAGAYFFLPAYSLGFAIANCLWSVVFVEYWKRQELDLAVRWGVRKVSQVQRRRAAFQHESEIEDPVTGEIVKFFPAWKRLARQALQIPFALGASGILSALYAVVFAIEIFIAEVYNGPFKSVLTFLPTVLLTVLVPSITSVLTIVATKLTDFENYDNSHSYETAMTHKIFVFNFICSYVPLFLTAFVYVPFGNLIMPHLDILGLAVQPSTGDEGSQITTTASPFQINPHRLRNQVIYFAVTDQVVNLAMETIVPYIKRKVFRKAKELHNKRKGLDITLATNDDADESEFLKRVRNEAELDVYDVHTDLREMTMQFGYLTLFSPIWPLAAVSFVVNAWVELRSDAAKICIEMQRPVPHRADSIGPWMNNLTFLTWMGSIVSAALIYLFSTSPDGTPSPYTLGGFLLAITFSEHIYIATRIVVRIALSKLESPGVQQDRRERYLLRKRYMEQSLGVDEEESDDVEGAKSGDEDQFWQKQKGGRGTVQAGLDIIQSSLGMAKKMQ
ncbi:hypothetical protein RUND412_010559 [Rhizina undulata]